MTCQEQRGSGLTASAPVSDVSTPACTNGMWPPLRPGECGTEEQAVGLAQTTKKTDKLKQSDFKRVVATTLVQS